MTYGEWLEAPRKPSFASVFLENSSWRADSEGLRSLKTALGPRDIFRTADDERDPLVELFRMNVKDRAPAVARLALGLVDNKSERGRFIKKAELPFRIFGVGGIKENPPP